MIARYKSYKQKSCNTTLDHCINVAQHLRNKAKYCFLISNGNDGWCSTRLVQPIFKKNHSSFTIGIGTHPESKKVQELWLNNKVTLAFENTREDASLVIYGKAFIETEIDVKRQYWQKVWKMFFPGGFKSKDYVVLRVEPQRMEVLSFKQNITPEPFGLKSVALELNQEKQWDLA